MSSLVGSRIDVPPSRDEIEVSIFGPGFGESILIHIGNNEWVIIDSCVDVLSGEPAALTYLKKINVDLSESIKLLIATHWHDDHIRGLAKIVQSSPNARFVCSAAIETKDFISLVKAYMRNILENKKGVEEFNEILEILNQRRVLPGVAVQDTLLYKASLNIDGEPIEVSIFSLSPSDYAVIASKIQIAKLLELKKEPMRSLLPVDPNYASIVVAIRIKDKSILLGSDLQERADDRTGWSVILKSSYYAKNKSSVFKVPHHGSANAHHPHVWIQMLEDQAYAVVTPFSRVRGEGLPKESDVTRICSLTRNAFITSDNVARQIKREWTIEKTIREAGIKIFQTEPPLGHVRLRSKISEGTWDVELFGNANSLCPN